MSNLSDEINKKNKNIIDAKKKFDKLDDLFNEVKTAFATAQVDNNQNKHLAIRLVDPDVELKLNNSLASMDILINGNKASTKKAYADAYELTSKDNTNAKLDALKELAKKMKDAENAMKNVNNVINAIKDIKKAIEIYKYTENKPDLGSWEVTVQNAADAILQSCEEVEATGVEMLAAARTALDPPAAEPNERLKAETRKAAAAFAARLSRLEAQAALAAANEMKNAVSGGRKKTKKRKSKNSKKRKSKKAVRSHDGRPVNKLATRVSKLRAGQFPRRRTKRRRSKNRK